MFGIEYSLEKTDRKFAIDASALRYSMFMGTIILRNNRDQIFIEEIPLFDFLLCLEQVCKELSKNEIGMAEFEFTESDEKLIFERTNTELLIRVTFSEEILKANFIDFQNQVKIFHHQLLEDIAKTEPTIYENKSFLNFLNDLGRN